MTPSEVLTRAGFEVHGTRATCPFCDGTRKLTVSIKGYLYYCHRCQRGGNVRSIAKEQCVTLPSHRIRKADIPKMRFRLWLSQKRTEFSKEEIILTRQWRYALAALAFFPEMQQAWDALANYYNAQARFALFWHSTSDKIGRFWLYRAWRRRNAF